MKISKETLQLLKNFSSINSSIFVKAGNTISTVSKSKNILATGTVSETFPVDFAIYDLAKFLGALSLFEEPELAFEAEHVTIKSGTKNHSIRYVFSAPENVNKPRKDRIVLPQNDVEFNLSAETVKDIVKASSLMSLPNMKIKGNGKTVKIVLDDSAVPGSSNYKVETGTDTDKKFEFVFKVENMKLLDGPYDVVLFFDQKKKMGFGYFNGNQAEYWIAIESDSSMK